MKLTNFEMSNYLIILNKISKKVTGKLAYAVSRNIRKLANEVLEFENIRNELIEKYGEKNDDGVFSIEMHSESYKKFSDEIEEYTTIEHDVDIFKIQPECLYDSTLNGDEMLQLDFMIEE